MGTSDGRIMFYVGVFLVTAATLMLQIVETRIISVVTWYYLAFLIVGLAMFGMTAGALKVYMDRERFTEKTVFQELAYNSHTLGALTAVTIVIQMAIPFSDWGNPVANFLNWCLLSVTVAVPFYFSGIVVALALTRSPFPIGRVYAVDLVGAALGCLATLALLNTVDAPSAVIWAGALASAGGLAFSRAAAAQATGAEPGRRRRVPGPAILAVLVLLALGNSVSGGLIRPIFVKGLAEIDNFKPIFTEWNSFSRISVRPDQIAPAHLWGPAPSYVPDDWIIPQRRHQIDASASTSAYQLKGDFSKAGFLAYDVTALAYHMPGIERAAVIGVGAGRDLVTARYFGVGEVTGVEINPILVRLLLAEPGFADFVGIGEDPAISIVVDEARSWFARSEKKFDLIQMSLIDTWASTGAGAFTLTENSLYTVEAWRIFLDHLSADGVLTISRHFKPDQVLETGRMVSLAMAAGFDRKFTDPRQHIMVAASDTVSTMIISRSPLDGKRLAALKDAAARLGHMVFLAPDQAPKPAKLLQIVQSTSPEDLAGVVAGGQLDLSPPTDNRPFFFNQLRFSTALQVIFGTIDSKPFEFKEGIINGNLEASKTLLLILFLSLLFAAATIIAPMRLGLKGVDGGLAFAGTAYFGLIGFGFMLVEIGLLQKFSVFLGHPIYALSIILFSIILFTGIGSALSERLVLTPRRLVLWGALTAGYIAVMAISTSDLLLENETAPLLTRALLSIVLIAPAGILMGFGFPTGMRLVTAIDARPTPWLWGINGAMGVIASVIAIVISISWGINITICVGALCYLLLIPAAHGIRSRSA